MNFRASLISAAYTAAGAILLFSFVAMMSSCAAVKPGAACDEGVAYCEGKASALACASGKYVSYPCTGSTGCTEADGGAVFCDQQSGATAGTSCLPAYNGTGQCSGDASTLLACSGGTWTALQCAPGTTCQEVAGHVGCK